MRSLMGRIFETFGGRSEVCFRVIFSDGSRYQNHEGTRTLEEAQRNKMDHVCRKLQLEPGDTLVDIGCGWGGFMFHAFDTYGALATGYNVTTAQVQALRQEIERQSLQDKLKVVEKDFREVEGQFDKCASIGVLEHAGKHQLSDHFQ
jgi:cyclopropane-fatty-acyl-phospholipid synthase